MKKIYLRGRDWLLMLVIQLMSMPVLADLPSPPKTDMPSDSSDSIDVGGALIVKGLKIACIAVGAGIFIGGAVGILNAYKTAHEKQDLTHFFKHGFISLIATAMGFGLCYFGYTILTNQNP